MFSPKSNRSLRIAILLFCFSLLSTSSKAQEIESLAEIRTEQTIEQMGDYGQYLPAVASVVLILTHNDTKGGWQYIKAASTNLLATYLLKFAINKDRPDGATDGHAFPSGHTSFAFQGASFLQRRYGWKYGIPAYAIASFVAFSRVEGINDRHDWFDVLGGIISGVGSSYLFTSEHQKERIKLTFNSNNNYYSVGIIYKF
ncbi:phosphatase PAP2 family protein [Psychroserpens sp. SPM9]|uniref:phosphatase PAP2 family protein n=1 Tax=Psychroserpens sp. SPM9 TaxID=2975598 RepID=UPI0021A5097D|nr:phosphatase PAP2 family protein [Psychroserpens sp. SPM9]MDG5491838.1 phosphatase PAP2 family protein [Psychroserpens sp. SPM9]